MNTRKITTFSRPVSALADRPQMSAAELKAWFDSNSTNELKTGFNSLLDELDGLNISGRIQSGDIKYLRQNTDGALETSADGMNWKGAVAADHVTVTIRPKTSALILTAAGWAASGENFVQTVEVSGVTGDTFVTLLPTAAQAARMLEDGTAALIPESGTGVVSVTSVGTAPTVDMTLEILLQEVNAE